MKTSLFFFSATGNSLVVAKDIAAKLSETQIFSIPQIINQEIELNVDNIGFIFPVYFSGMPKIVVDFINKLESSNSKYIFAICTCGSFPMGTLLQTQNQLRTKGMTLNAGFSIQMPGNYLVKYSAFSIEKQKNMFIEEKKKVETIVKIIKNQKENKIERNNFLINGIGNLAYRSMLPKFQTLDKNFNVDEKCNSCNTCEKVCPVQNIKIMNGRPNWLGNCEHCLACIQWCPTESIQYGTQTNNRKRYHNPEVLVKELYRES
jgi:flavodoxin/Pyruvate/2-oxoacid:ferredoxin oxidoreductase delta subunit